MLSKILILFISFLMLLPDCRGDTSGRQGVPSDQLANSNCPPVDTKSCIQTLSKPWEHQIKIDPKNPEACIFTKEPWTDFNQIPSICRNMYMNDLAWTIYQQYGLPVKMNDMGTATTEGMYIQCNQGIDIDQCLSQPQNFNMTTDIAKATPGYKIALNSKNGNPILNNGQDCYCPLTHCDVNSSTIRFYDGYGSYSLNIGESSPPAQVPGTSKAVSLYTVMQAGDNICLMLNTSTGYITLGCKAYYTATDPKPDPAKDSCFKNTACNADRTNSASKVFWRASSRVIECLSDTIDIALLDTCNGVPPPIDRLQGYLRTPIIAVLLLYVILLGVKITTTGALPKPPELILDIIKIGVVLWLAVGTANTDTPQNSPDYYKTGLPWIYSTGKTAMHSLASYVLTAASTDSLCSYEESQYPKGKEYLAIWDSLDCRVAYYLGLYRLTGDYNTSGILGVFGVIIPALLSLELIFVILLIVYGLFVLALLIYFIEFYAICLIMLAVVVYLGVIMVPFILFGFTKKFFDSWLTLVMSYVLQPIIVMGFLSLALLVFDTVIFGKCKFTPKTVGSDYTYWSIDTSSDCASNDPRCSSPSADSCQATFGYKVLQTLDYNSVTSVSGLFADYAILNANIINDMPTIIVSLLKIAIFGYLLLLFCENINGLAAELSGGIKIDSDVKPAELFKAMASKLTGTNTQDLDKIQEQAPADSKPSAKAEGEGGDKAAQAGKQAGNADKGIDVSTATKAAPK